MSDRQYTFSTTTKPLDQYRNSITLQVIEGSTTVASCPLVASKIPHGKQYSPSSELSPDFKYGTLYPVKLQSEIPGDIKDGDIGALTTICWQRLLEEVRLQNLEVNVYADPSSPAAEIARSLDIPLCPEAVAFFTQKDAA